MTTSDRNSDLYRDHRLQLYRQVTLKVMVGDLVWLSRAAGLPLGFVEAELRDAWSKQEDAARKQEPFDDR